MSTVDAILVPHMYPEGKTDRDLLVARNEEFGPLLGAKRVYNRSVHSISKDLVTKNADDPTYFFPTNHPHLAGQLRHVWTERPAGDGVLYGTLVPDTITPAENADLAAASVAEAKAQVEKTAAAAATVTPMEPAHAS